MVRSFLPLLLAASLAAAQQPPTRERGRFSLQGDPAVLLQMDPGTKVVLIGFNAGLVSVFPADQKVVQVHTFQAHKKAVTGAGFLADAKSFATTSADGSLKVWDTAAALKYQKAMEEANGDAAKVEAPKPTYTVTAHAGSVVTALAVSPDGTRLATGSSEGVVKLWDAGTLKALASQSGAHPGGVRGLAFAPDGKALGTGGADKTARLWDVSADKLTASHKLTGPEGPVNAVAFSPDGKHLAAGTGVPKKSGSIHVWEAETGKPAYRLTGPEDVVTCLVFHPKTAHLASGGADRLIRVWDLKEKAQQSADENAEPLRNMVISPDGVRFGTCSDRSVRWWAGFGK